MTLNGPSNLWCPVHGEQFGWTTLRVVSPDGRRIVDEDRFCDACLLAHWRSLYPKLYASQEESDAARLEAQVKTALHSL